MSLVSDIIHIRIDDELKEWAEVFAAASGKNLTQYITDLINGQVLELSEQERLVLRSLRARMKSERSGGAKRNEHPPSKKSRRGKLDDAA